MTRDRFRITVRFRWIARTTALIILASLVCPQQVLADNYYVNAATGNNTSGTGTQSSRWKTITTLSVRSPGQDIRSLLPEEHIARAWGNRGSEIEHPLSPQRARHGNESISALMNLGWLFGFPNKSEGEVLV